MDRKSLIVFEFVTPGGQTKTFGVQVGEGEIQSQNAPGGVDVSVMLVQFPEHIFFVKGELSKGAGLIVTERELVGPGFAQFVFVP